MYLYLNGEFVHQKDAFISPFDHGYLYGLGVFETLRVYKGHPFLLDDHLERLRHGLIQLNISYSIDREMAENIINELLQLNNLQDAYVRINISAGEEELGLSANPYVKPTVIFFMKDIHLPKNQQKEGRFLTIKRNSPEGSFRLKSHHFLNNMLAKREIGPNPKVEGIFLTEEGYVAEGIVSNIFWVHNNIVYTPSINTGILNGITRQFVLECLRKLDIPFIEGFFTPNELLKSDEVFITNSLQEIVPITNIGNHHFLGQAGNVAKQLKDLYEKSRHHLYSRHQL
ncbi:aminodeoxychorismate lyase [Aeribacillus alveayuensis]|uniref:4-amino-4-deoxychorismate lyase n=1 Tax=Aeribacillus alveayuensis TaxID=279215 RepID=A0ABT9VQX6_9BACI|nr:4-amino-4-deoxychorismate lyase [Bacillus alveayuensis]